MEHLKKRKNIIIAIIVFVVVFILTIIISYLITKKQLSEIPKEENTEFTMEDLASMELGARQDKLLDAVWGDNWDETCVLNNLPKVNGTPNMTFEYCIPADKEQLYYMTLVLVEMNPYILIEDPNLEVPLGDGYVVNVKDQQDKFNQMEVYLDNDDKTVVDGYRNGNYFKFYVEELENGQD